MTQHSQEPVELTRRTAMISKTVELMTRYGRGPGGVELNIQSGIGSEGFRIEDAAAGKVRITGNDGNGLLYGAGKFLRDPGWRGTSVPEKKIRAIYFATHFHNFYHDAPVEEVCRYVEELALWGCNTLMVWFDMHHYTGCDDPAAQAMIARLRAILQAAQGVGMRPALATLANEAFASSPAALRSDFRWKENGYRSDIGAYGVEICPNKPGGLELICQYRQQVLDAFAGLNIGYYGLGAYDQGGCTCPQCRPWGCNGYLRTAEAVARLVRRNLPDAKTVLGTWYFDKHIAGEWEGLSRAFAGGKPDWVDYLLADDCGHFPEYPLKHGVPGGLPVVSFPEISMQKMWPWGAFGANPRLTYWQQYWDSVGSRLTGSFPYSEGIYEDINKVLQLQRGWDGQRSMRDIAREYAAAEFSPAVADDVVDAMLALEEAMNHAVDYRTIYEVLHGGGWEGFPRAIPRIYVQPPTIVPQRALQTLRRVQEQLPVEKRTAWRWRILMVRALLDEELHRSEGRPTPQSDIYFDELSQIYHADDAESIVSPPSRAALTRLFYKPA